MIKRWILFALLAFVVIVPCHAQEGGAETEEAREQRVVFWKWLNFAILAGGLGYLIAKKAPAFFNARSEEIQRAIKEATGLKMNADFRASEIDRRMATLSSEIHKIREEAKAEMERESRRIDEETRLALLRIQEHTTREIESLRVQAAAAVREHAVRLAADLAISHLRDHPERVNQDDMVRAFAGDVLKGAR
jgi:F0F1-type ATP synthase membrane subunit b/b'